MMDEKTLNMPVAIGVHTAEPGWGEWIPEKLVDAIVWLQGILEQVPIEYRDAVTIKIDSDYDCGGVNIYISYLRPPTEAEKQERLDEHHRYRSNQEANERALLEQLRTKYG